MTVDKALEWAAKNCDAESVSRLRSRAAAKALAEEVLRVQADLAYDRLKTSGQLQQLEADRALAEQMKWGG